MSDAQGRFTIADLPPGTYDIFAWHSYHGRKIRRVTVDGMMEVDFAFDASDRPTPPHSADLPQMEDRPTPPHSADWPQMEDETFDVDDF